MSSFQWTAEFDWLAVLQIIWIDLLLSGDNAMVIALACRQLPERQRKWGAMLGAGAAVLLRVALTGVVTQLMDLPWLRLIGGLLLFWIALKLLVDEDEDEAKIGEASSLMRAVWLIVVADAVMSLDNVIAVAAAAKGHFALIVFGLLLSIPIVVAGSRVVMWLMDRFAIIVWAGAALLGSLAGGLIGHEPAIARALPAIPHVGTLAQTIGAALVVLIGWLWSQRPPTGAKGG